jgi:hypothetical protein
MCFEMRPSPTPPRHSPLTTGNLRFRRVCHRDVDKGHHVGENGEGGAILILAMIFLVAISIAILALSNWTENSLNDSLRFRNISEKLYAADGATQIAIRASRYTYLNGIDSVNPPLGYICPGTSSPVLINTYWVQDWCSTQFYPETGSTITRAITVTACLMPSGSSSLAENCAGAAQALLTAVIDIDDITSPNETPAPCTSVANESTCGVNMTIYGWNAT